jgi:hypothetical protein
MPNEKQSRRQPAALPEPAAGWVRDALEPDQLTKAKHPWGRQVLSRRTVILLWGLRVYVLLMVFLVVLQTWNAFHAPR